MASLDANPQGPPPGESLYIPKPQLVKDRRFLHDFMDEYAFVDLVTVTPSLRITHKFKLGQDRSPDDKQSLLTKLGTGKAQTTLQDFTANFYAWQSKA